MKLAVFVPVHPMSLEAVYMARCQARFLNHCVKKMDAVGIMSVDEDRTGLFDREVLLEKVKLLDLRGKDIPKGIVEPTQAGIMEAKRLGAELFCRITEDTQIVDFEAFRRMVDELYMSGKGFLFGGRDVCNDISGYAKGMDVPIPNGPVEFVQGNFMLAPTDLWEKWYMKLPGEVKHYCDDSMFSHAVRSMEKVEPVFCSKPFWRHNRTRDVYYLESLFQEG